MELSEFEYYIRALGFNDDVTMSNGYPGRYSFIGNKRYVIEVDARLDKDLESHYRFTCWYYGIPKYNFDLRGISGVGDLLRHMDSYMTSDSSSVGTPPIYDEYKHSLLISILRDKKIQEVLGGSND